MNGKTKLTLKPCLVHYQSSTCRGFSYMCRTILKPLGFGFWYLNFKQHNMTSFQCRNVMTLFCKQSEPKICFCCLEWVCKVKSQINFIWTYRAGIKKQVWLNTLNKTEYEKCFATIQQLLPIELLLASHINSKTYHWSCYNVKITSYKFCYHYGLLGIQIKLKNYLRLNFQYLQND